MPRLLGLLLLLAVLAWGADLTGTWDAKVETSAGSGTPVFTFKQDGNRLSGDYSGQLGTAKVTGSVTGSEVEWSFTADLGGQSGKIVYKGKVDGKKITGTVDLGGMAEGTFTAIKR